MKKAHEIGRQGEAIALHFLACKKHNIFREKLALAKSRNRYNFSRLKDLSFC